LRDAVEFDFDPVPPRAPISQVEQVNPAAHVLYSTIARLHCFEAGFKQQFLENGSPTWTLGFASDSSLNSSLAMVAREYRRVRSLSQHKLRISLRPTRVRKNLVASNQRAQTRSPADCRSSKTRTSTSPPSYTPNIAVEATPETRPP